MQRAPLPEVFGDTGKSTVLSDPEPQLEQPQILEETPEGEAGQRNPDDEEIDDEIAAFKEDWEAYPTTRVIDMSKILDTEPSDLRESEGSITAECPWKEVAPDSRTANFHNCRDQKRKLGWIERLKREKQTSVESSARVIDFRPKTKRTRKGGESPRKGKGKNMDRNT